MKALKWLALPVLMCGVASANVTLNVDEHIKVTAINGESITHGLLSPVKRNFELPSGQATITARYERLFDLNSKEHDVVRSKEVTLTATLADNQTYRLTLPNPPKHHTDAVAFAKKPHLDLVQGDKVVTQKMTVAQKSGGLLGGFGALFGKNDSQPVQITQTPVQPATPAQTQKTTLDKFMELWLSADESEREKIRQWVQK